MTQALDFSQLLLLVLLAAQAASSVILWIARLLSSRPRKKEILGKAACNCLALWTLDTALLYHPESPVSTTINFNFNQLAFLHAPHREGGKDGRKGKGKEITPESQITPNGQTASSHRPCHSSQGYASVFPIKARSALGHQDCS